MNDVQRSNARSEKRSSMDILARLEAYENLNQQFQRYATLEQNAEKERGSVQLHIYEKVRREYEEKRVALEQDLNRQEALLQDQLQELLHRRAELDRLCRQETERLEEIDFRIRVGEYSEEECEAARSEIEERTHNQSHELARLEEIATCCAKSGLLADVSAETQSRDFDESAGTPNQAFKDSSNLTAPAPPQPSTEEKRTKGSEPTQPVESEEDFQVVEENPALDDPDSPIVHCPPNLSVNMAPATKALTSPLNRPGPQVESNGHVTGYLVALEGSRQGERFPMISSNITLGNSPGIDIRLSDSGIGNFHARILYKERKHYLENLDSMGRSFVNGIQVAQVVELRDGDVIRLGDIKLQVEYASAPARDPN